jgi:hypothetical protein
MPRHLPRPDAAATGKTNRPSVSTKKEWLCPIRSKTRRSARLWSLRRRQRTRWTSWTGKRPAACRSTSHYGSGAVGRNSNLISKGL